MRFLRVTTLVETLPTRQTPFGPIVYRAVDHQSTMGAYVGQLAKKNGKGVMVNWHYADGNSFLPPPAEARALRGQ